MCDGECVDTSLDLRHCGGCGRTCGTTCAAAVCAVELLGETRGVIVGSEGFVCWHERSAPSVYVVPRCVDESNPARGVFSPLPDGAPRDRDMRADSGFLYLWTEGQIVRLDRTGARVDHALGSPRGYDWAVQSGFVFFEVYNGLELWWERYELATGARTSAPWASSVVGDGLVLSIAPVAPDSDEHRLALHDAFSGEITEATVRPKPVAYAQIAGGRVVWAEIGAFGEPWAIQIAPLSDLASVTTLASGRGTGGESAHVLAADESEVFFSIQSSSDQTFERVPADGSAAPTLLAHSPPQGAVSRSMVVTPNWLYWLPGPVRIPR
jgi:hypothetical protein